MTVREVKTPATPQDRRDVISAVHVLAHTSIEKPFAKDVTTYFAREGKKLSQRLLEALGVEEEE